MSFKRCQVYFTADPPGRLASMFDLGHRVGVITQLDLIWGSLHSEKRCVVSE